MKPIRRQVRISQCMIVRNEEKNIRKALSWGKNVVYEQIVVDTGSTDRTVELAREMGAEVLFFEWTDDFSAAKNFAIRQAGGDFIAFLDADEYFTPEDAEKLYEILADLKNKPEMKKRDLVIQSAWLHQDETGKVFATSVQNRVFSNSGNIRYKNKIHETLFTRGQGQSIMIDTTKTLSIYHTGYSQAAFHETQKAERNIRLLKKQLEEEPENYDAWSYLGESLMAAHNYEEAEPAFQRVVSNPGAKMLEERRTAAYFNLLRIIVLKDQPDAEQKINDIYNKARAAGAISPDIEYMAGIWMYKHKKQAETIIHLERALVQLENFDKTICIMAASELENIYGMLSHTYLQLGKKAESVRYATLTLRKNRFMDAALETILTLFKDEPGQYRNPVDTIRFVEKLYRFSELKDKLYILKSAKKVGFHSLYDQIFSLLNAEEQKWLLTRNESPYRLTRSQAEEKYPEFSYRNEVDAAFLELVEEIKSKSEEELCEQIISGMKLLQKEHPNEYNLFLDMVEKYPYWGELDPPVQKFDALAERAGTLKNHIDEFLWLYMRLADYRSRRCLYAVLSNWLRLNRADLTSVIESGTPYFDLDLVPAGQDEVFVDAGAFVGDSTLDFIRTYGEDYRRIYCYEIASDSMERLKRNTQPYQNIEPRQRAVYSREGTLYLLQQNDTALNSATETGTTAVQAVSLDEDVKEPVTFIKISIEGLEKEALEGSRRHIQEEHPRLAVSTGHSYDDLFKIPRQIAELNPSYRFYLRYYGGNLIPTEIIVYAV